jgi:hypothetical protein
MLTRSKGLTTLAALLMMGSGISQAQDREVRQAERAADRAANATDRAQDQAEEVRDAAPRARDEAPRKAAARTEDPAPPAENDRDAVPARDNAAAEPNARQAPSQTYRAKQVLGAKLTITGDVSIGTVDDIVFADDGYIEYLIVQNEGKMVTVPWEAAKFDFEKRIATVNVTQEQFRQVPTYTQQQYPTYSAPAYRTQIYKAYGIGLTNGQERRADRRTDRR